MRIGVYRTESRGCQIIHDYLSEKFEVCMFGRKDVELERIFRFDVAVFPGGWRHLYAATVSCRFFQAMHRYMMRGGGFLGICGGALLAWLLDIARCKMKFIRLFPYYLYYSATGRKGEVKIVWNEGNLLGERGIQRIAWAASPYIIDSGLMRAEAFYAEDKPFLPLSGKVAVASGNRWFGRVFLFCPHPEYQCSNGDNMHLIEEAIEWLTYPEMKKQNKSKPSLFG